MLTGLWVRPAHYRPAYRFPWSRWFWDHMDISYVNKWSKPGTYSR